jgi:transposase
MTMMGYKEEQMELLLFNPEEWIPQNHLLKKIDRVVSFNFIYDLLAPTYSDKGRPSIDPVCLIKMLLIGYLYGIKSERRLTEEISLNIAYRWFCGFRISDKIPDHSSFTKNRKQRWQKTICLRKFLLRLFGNASSSI